MLNDKEAVYITDGSDNNKVEHLNNTFLYKSSDFYDPLVLYNYKFGKIPSLLVYKHQLRSNELENWVISTYSENIIDSITSKDFFYDSSILQMKKNFIEHCFFMSNNVLVWVTWNHFKVLFNAKDEDSVRFANSIFEQADKKIRNLKKKVKKNIFLLMNLQFGLELKELPLKKKKFNIVSNYNDDIPNKEIIEKLNSSESGMYLFYGEPGTGKSSYIEYLINQLNKTVIFLSPKNASAIDDPNFTEILVNNPNSIIIVEDAELLLKSRDKEINSNGISTLLSITDGLLGSLGIQVIATFNTQLSMIDKALLRKGRCKVIYEFKPLSVEKTNFLLKQFGFIEEHQSRQLCLSDIYYYNDNTPENISKKQIGFSK